MSTRPIAGCCVLLLAFGSAIVGAAEPAGAKGGVLWEETVEMTTPAAAGFTMPAQTRQVCRPADPDQWSGLPSGGRDEDCRVTDMKRSGSKASWKITCERSRASGDGEMSWAADTYSGTVNVRSAEHGQFTSKMRGRKLGGACDPERERQAMEERSRQIAAMQATAAQQNAQQEAQLAAHKAQICESAVTNLDFNLLTNYPDCKARLPDACARFQSLEGYQQVAKLPPSMQAAPESHCGVKMASVKEALCVKAPQGLRKDAPTAEPAKAPQGARKDAPTGDRENWKIFEFVAANCPREKLALVQEECAGRSWTGKNAPADWVRSFCVSFAQQELTKQRATPASAAEPTPSAEKIPPAPAKSPQDEAVEKAKKAAKGLFGF